MVSKGNNRRGIWIITIYWRGVSYNGYARAIKRWTLPHPIANEWFTIIKGESKLLLEDIQTKEKMEMYLKFEDAKTIMIPSGVAHAFLNEGNHEFIVLAYTDQLYHPEDTIAYNLI